LTFQNTQLPNHLKPLTVEVDVGAPEMTGKKRTNKNIVSVKYAIDKIFTHLLPQYLPIKKAGAKQRNGTLS
jgi:hypothetical protein